MGSHSRFTCHREKHGGGIGRGEIGQRSCHCLVIHHAAESAGQR
jgi:hypothetical protein